eukprot:744122-Pyramimonas_sp.AAC.1
MLRLRGRVEHEDVCAELAHGRGHLGELRILHRRVPLTIRAIEELQGVQRAGELVVHLSRGIW